MMDASSVLRDIASLASTAQDSQERFEARKLWPGFAKRLRDVGPAAPIIAALVTGAKDSEATLSETYGGKSQEPGVSALLNMCTDPFASQTLHRRTRARADRPCFSDTSRAFASLCFAFLRSRMPCTFRWVTC